MAASCAPVIRRSPLSASPLPPLDPTHPLNYLALSLQHESQPRLYRLHALSSYRWPAYERWSASYFVQSAASARGPAQLLVKRSHTPTVRFANLRTERPFVRNTQAGSKVETTADASRDGVQWPQQPLFHTPFRTQNLSTRAFFREIMESDAQASDGSSSSDYLYFADGVSVLGPVLSQDIVPAEPLCPHADLNRCDMSLWIGRAGVTAHTHYDSSHNMFAQIRGRKRFVLAPPSAARCGLGLYPSLHPYYRQTHQDGLLDGSLDASNVSVLVPARSGGASGAATAGASACCTLELLEVVLEPGDLLYIPPHWFHRVTSMPSSPPSPSFSVSSWWAGPAFETAAQVLRQPLPFESGWTRHQMVFAARLYLHMLYQALETHLRAVDPDHTPPEQVGSFLAAELLVTRFYPLFNTINTQEPIGAQWCEDMRRNVTSRSSATSAARALASCHHIDVAAMRELLPTSVVVPPDAATPVILAALRTHFSSYVDRQLSLYRRLDAEMAVCTCRTWWRRSRGSPSMLAPSTSIRTWRAASSSIHNPRVTSTAARPACAEAREDQKRAPIPRLVWRIILQLSYI